MSNNTIVTPPFYDRNSNSSVLLLNPGEPRIAYSMHSEANALIETRLGLSALWINTMLRINLSWFDVSGTATSGELDSKGPNTFLKGRIQDANGNDIEEVKIVYLPDPVGRLAEVARITLLPAVVTNPPGMSVHVDREEDDVPGFELIYVHDGWASLSLASQYGKMPDGTWWYDGDLETCTLRRGMLAIITSNRPNAWTAVSDGVSEPMFEFSYITRPVWDPSFVLPVALAK